MRSEPRTGRGLVFAGASALLPGLGQFFLGDVSQAFGIFFVWAVCTASLIRTVPLVGPVAGLVGAGTWIYAVIDAFRRGRLG